MPEYLNFMKEDQKIKCEIDWKEKTTMTIYWNR